MHCRTTKFYCLCCEAPLVVLAGRHYCWNCGTVPEKEMALLTNVATCATSTDINTNQGNKMTTNPTTAVFLINNDVQAVMASYSDDFSDRAGSPKMFKTFDKSLKVGDLVVVPTNTRHGFTIAKITEVNTFPDLKGSSDVKWIVAKVDKSYYDTLLEQEEAALKEIREAEMRQQREDLAASLFKNNQEKLKALPLAQQKASE